MHTESVSLTQSCACIQDTLSSRALVQVRARAKEYCIQASHGKEIIIIRQINGDLIFFQFCSYKNSHVTWDLIFTVLQP